MYEVRVWSNGGRIIRVKYLVGNLPSVISSTTNPTWTRMGWYPTLPDVRLATNPLIK